MRSDSACSVVRVRIGDAVAGAVTSAGFGSLTGGAIAGVTGGDVLSGAESGMTTGAMTGGLLGGLGVTSYASGAPGTAAPGTAGPMPDGSSTASIGSNISENTGIAASGAAGTADQALAAPGAAAPVTSGTALGTNGAASSGAGGPTVNTATSAAPLATPVPTAVDATATSGAAGNLDTSTSYAMGDGMPTAPGTPIGGLSDPTGTSTATTNPADGPINATPSAGPNVPAGATGPVTIPGNTLTGADGNKYVSNGTSWNPAPPGGLAGLISGPNGSLVLGGLGYAVSGIGGGLLSQQTAQDQAGYTAAAAKTAIANTAGNYGVQIDPVTGATISNTGGGLLTQGAAPTGLRSPAQAFNPTARWVYDSTSKALVLVNPAGTPTS